MAIIRRVWGPFGHEVLNEGTPAAEARWYFIGIRGDRTTAHWCLIFKPEGRKFSASASQLGSAWRGRAMQAASKELPDTYPNDAVHPDAFLDDSPVMEGRTVDILRERLSPADFARCTALAIARKG